MISRALNPPLSWIGLMRVSEHDEKVALITRFEQERQAIIAGEVERVRERFNRAAADLAAQSVKAADLAVEVQRLRTELVARKRLAELQGAVMEKLRPDAEAMRRKRTNDAAAARLKRRGNK